MLFRYYKDNQYLNTHHFKRRKISRAILLDKNNNVCILTIERNDIFGNYKYIETPGGGKEKKESYEKAIIREIDEEVGVKCIVIKKIGIIVDYYNLLNRKNINHYFLCKIVGNSKIHHESYGDSFIKNISFYPIKEIIDMYNNLENTGVPFLIKRRELPIFLKAYNILNNGEFNERYRN